MNRSTKLLWSSVVMALVMALAAKYLTGCGGSGKEAAVAQVTADVTECSKRITATLFVDDGCTTQAACCNQAQFRVDAIVRGDPHCKGWHPFEVCALLTIQPGGPDAGH